MMTTYMQFTQQSTLSGLERLRNSRNGNPRFKLTLANGQTGKTKTDASFAYAICDSWQGKLVRAEYRVTKKGDLLFTNLDLVNA